MKDARLLLGIGIVLCCALSCDESFNPSAAFEPRMVVYSILTTDSDTQYVRVYSTYNPPDNDPTRNRDEISVKDAQVSISQEGGPAFSFHPMTIPRSAKNRYASDVVAYYSYPFRPERGKTYILNVSSASFGTVSAMTTVPGAGTITPVNPQVLENPFYTSYDFGVSVALSPEAKGYLTRIFVDYLYPPGDWTYQPKRFEIPLSRVAISCFWDLFKETFPRATLRSTPSTPPVWVPLGQKEYKPEERVSYSSAALCHKVDDLYLTGREGCVQFRQAVFYTYPIRCAAVELLQRGEHV
jgi:hypothetical protein